MRAEQGTFKTGLAICDLKKHGLEIGMRIEIQVHQGKKKRSVSGEVLAINDRIFTLATETYRRIESFHLADLHGNGGISVRVRS